MVDMPSASRTIRLAHIVVALSLPWRALASASGSDRSPIQLNVEGCSPSMRNEIRRILQIEVRPVVVLAGSAPQADARHVSVVCQEVAVQITLTNAQQQVVTEREVQLDPKRERAHARLLALAIAELVGARAGPGAAAETAEVVQPEPPAQPSPPPAPSQPRRSLTTGAGLSHRAFLGHGPRLWGAGIEVESAPVETWWGIRAAGDYCRGIETTAPGRVTVEAWSVAAGLWLGADFEGLDAAAWLGGRLGLARLTGSAYDSSVTISRDLSGRWGGPALGLELVVHATDRLTIPVNAEAGLTLARVIGEVPGHSDVGLKAPWVSITLGFGWVWGPE